jgi:hypothetical protein
MRVNDRFPIERFTAMGHVGNWGECEYLQTMGRFAFETPTRIDQRWLIQAGSRVCIPFCFYFKYQNN